MCDLIRQNTPQFKVYISDSRDHNHSTTEITMLIDTDIQQ